MSKKMFDSRKQNPNCRFAMEIVTYIYDEMHGDEKSEFEQHLSSCYSCPEEITALISISSNVREWRDGEFASIPTPVINIPYQTAAKAENIDISTPNRTIWSKVFYDLFNFQHLAIKSATAFAALLVILTLGWVLVHDNSNSGNLAKEDSQKIENDNPAPINQEKEPESKETVISQSLNDSQNSEKSTVASSQDVAISKPVLKRTNNSTKNTVAKIKKSGKDQNLVKTNKNSLPKPKVGDIKNKRQETIAIKDVPGLTDYAIDETDDKDLRLTDLFDDVGSDD